MEPSLAFVKDLSRRAGEILKEGYGKAHTVEHKGPIDLVTEIDKKAEDFIVGEIKSAFPDHSIVTEESGNHAGQEGKKWFIDPVDGTSNYSRGVPIFAVSIAYAENGSMRLGCVYDPMRDECFNAERGKGAFNNETPIHVSATDKLIDAMLVTGFPYDMNQGDNNIQHFVDISTVVHSVRRLGSAALDLVYVAAGRLDGYWEIGIEAWDIAAGTLIIEEAGGKVTTTKGEADYMRPPYDVLTTNGILHEKLLKFFI